MAKQKTPAQEAAEAKAQLERQRRTFIEIASGSGQAHEEIALLCEPSITVEELRRDYAVELERGPAKANLETVMGLRAAIKKGNVGAMIYWTKAQMGWTEKGPSTKDQPADDGETRKPAKMPTAKSLEETILPFKARS